MQQRRIKQVSPIGILIIVFLGVTYTAVQAKVKEHEVEQERLSGYKDHVLESQIYDRERLRAYHAYLESVEKDLFEKQKALREFKLALKKQGKSDDESINFKVFLEEKNAEMKEYWEAELEYKKNKKKSSIIENRRDFTEEEELGIYAERPRYDYKKRALYGAKPKYKIATKGGSSNNGANSSPDFAPDFATDSGFIPPPPPLPTDMPNEPFYDEIPPPPPPIPSDFGNGGDFGDGYIPPPPPPPPMFDGEF